MEDFKFSEHFTNIYENDIWGCGSGGGSTIDNTVEYRKFIEDFIKNENIKSTIDYGCGDWQSSKLINWGSSSYLGIDCVDFLIKSHIKDHETNDIKFEYVSDIYGFLDKEYIGDLLVIKDVIQHWLLNEIIYFLDNIRSKFKFILITNSSRQNEEWVLVVDVNSASYRSRPLSAKFYPLNKYNTTILKTYSLHDGSQDIKEISLITT